jgi:hypothetical protein
MHMASCPAPLGMAVWERPRPCALSAIRLISRAAHRHPLDNRHRHRCGLCQRGGLGTLIFDGVRSSNREKIVAGAIAVAALAMAANALLRRAEIWASRGLQ